MMGLRYLPWWAKIGGKIVLSRLPVSYNTWRKLGLFKHGYMNQIEYAIRTFEGNFNHACEYATLPAGFHALELGPGDSILSGILAKANGAGQIWLVDVGAFADTRVEVCQQLVQMLRNRGGLLPNITDAKSLQDVLERMSTHYLTKGALSLAEIPNASIDYFWSQAVLEHISRQEFPTLLKELRRIVSDTAIGVHVIDFKDHLGGGLNNLRFSEATWEGALFRNSGFYTNRLRPREMIAMFEQAGFSVELLEERRWPEMPITRNRLAPEFQALPDEDFMVSGIKIVVRPCL